MSILQKALFWILLVFIFTFAGWYVMHGDIYFSSDIARDFFLLGEIAQKKIVLIGPRSSTGLFHGPLWLYLNFPAYFIGKGNPLVVGWWWVILSGISLIPAFFIAKRLFTNGTAYLYTLLLGLFYAFNARGLFNPHGAMFVMPIFFYFFVMYIREGKVQYLLGHLLATAALIQFQMADGIPFAILSLIAFTLRILKTKQFAHLLFFPMLAVFLGNFIIFDIRHQHLLLDKVLDFVSPLQKGHRFDYLSLIFNRFSLFFSSPEILRRNIWQANTILFLMTLGGMLFPLRKKNIPLPYLSFIYLYLGFFVLSFLNKGDILYFYLFPLFPIILLMFTSLATRYKKIFVPLFFIVFLFNMHSAWLDIHDAVSFIGKDLNSWKFLSQATTKIFDSKDTRFGYFVYSPDVVAFEGRYAMEYAQKTHPQKLAVAYKKLPVTYLFIAPPPRNNPYMHDDWWRLHQLNINADPKTTTIFDNAYKIQRVELSKEEQEVPYDPNINPGITFR